LYEESAVEITVPKTMMSDQYHGALDLNNAGVTLLRDGS